MHIVSDGLHQVGFSEAHSAVDKQRIVRFTRRLCRRECGRAGEPVAVARDKGIKCIFRIEMRIGIIRPFRKRFTPALFCFLLADNQRLMGLSVRFGQAVFNFRKIFLLDHGNQRFHHCADDDRVIFFHDDGIHISLYPGSIRQVIHPFFQQGAGRLPERFKVHPHSSCHFV